MTQRIALVKMPWTSASASCLASGLLKALLARENIPVDVFYLNLHMAKRLDYAEYEATCQMTWAEIAFAQAAFGRTAMGDPATAFDEEFRMRYFYPLIPKTASQFWEGDQAGVYLSKLARKIVPEFLDDCLNRISWGEYSVVGFVSSASQHVASLALSRRIKERFPAIKIVFGSSNVSGSMGHETLRAFKWIDYVVDGEGDRSFPQIVRNILDGNPFLPVPGISFRSDGEIFINEERYPPTNMDELPVPDYSDFSCELAATGMGSIVGLPMHLFESSRGCWWVEKVQCSFCGVNGQAIMYRRKASPNVVRELASLATEHGATNFVATDSVADPELCKTFFPALKQYQTDSGHKFSLFYEVKASMSKEELAVMQEGGVVSVQAGIESLNSDLLRLMRKGLTVLENIQFLKWCREKKIRVFWNMLIDIPGETSSHYDQMLRLLPLVSHLEAPISLTPVILSRYSAYHNVPETFGIKNVRPWRLYRYIYPPEVNLDEIAYYFDYDGGTLVTDPEGSFNAMSRAVDDWVQLFRSGKTVFEYTVSEDGDRVEMFDSRPPAAGWNIMSISLTLIGLKAKIFLYCDKIRSLPEISDHLAVEAGGRVTGAELQSLLDELAAENIIYGEDGRYLSLATYRSPEGVAGCTEHGES